jgi:hypothetical protein
MFVAHSTFCNFPIDRLISNQSTTMRLQLNDSINFPSMVKVLTERFPNYKVELKKNPIARFEFIQVYKSAFVGLWIRIYPDKNRVLLIKTIPSNMARAVGAIAFLIGASAKSKLEKEVAAVLQKEFNTAVQA